MFKMKRYCCLPFLAVLVIVGAPLVLAASIVWASLNQADTAWSHLVQPQAIDGPTIAAQDASAGHSRLTATPAAYE